MGVNSSEAVIVISLDTNYINLAKASTEDNRTETNPT